MSGMWPMRIQLAAMERQRGAASVELAVCLPLMLLVLTGLWEVGRITQVAEVMWNSRARSRAGRLPRAGHVECRHDQPSHLSPERRAVGVRTRPHDLVDRTGDLAALRTPTVTHAGTTPPTANFSP